MKIKIIVGGLFLLWRYFQDGRHKSSQNGRYSWPLTPYMTLKKVKMVILFGIFESLSKFTFNLMYHSTKSEKLFLGGDIDPCWPWSLKRSFFKVIRFNRSIAQIEGIWKEQQTVNLNFEILTFFKVKFWGQGHKTGKKSWFWHFWSSDLTLRESTKAWGP